MSRNNESQYDERWQEVALAESDLAVRLLRAAIHHPTVMGELIGIGTTKDDFLAPALRVVWRCAVSIFERVGKVDTILLSSAIEDVLDSQHKARQVLDLIMEAEPLRDGADVSTTMRFLRERVALTRIQRLGTRLTTLADAADANPLVLLEVGRAELETIVLSAQTPTGITGKDLARSLIEQISNDKTPWESVPFGIPSIDLALGGGIPIGRTGVIIGGTSVGKTTFCCHFLIAAARYLRERGETGLFVTFESDVSEIARGIGQMMAKARVIKGLGREASSGLANAAAQLDTDGWWPITMEYVPTSMSAEQFNALVRGHKRRMNGKLRAVWLDYAQDLRLPKGFKGNEGHAENAGMLRQLAQTEELALFLFSQIAADAKCFKEKKARIEKEDTAGSKKFSKDASAVIAIERKIESKDERVRDTNRIGLLKNRFNGILEDTFMKYDWASAHLFPCTEDGAPISPETVAEADEVWGDA